MKAWRLAHNSLAVALTLAWLSALAPSLVHRLVGLAPLPVLLALLWVGRAFLPRVRRPAPASQLNAIFSRLCLVLLVLSLATGLAAEVAEGVLARGRLLSWHGRTVDLFAPTLAAHVGLSLWLRARRSRSSRAD